MKKLTTILVLIFTANSFAQFGNEWIDYSAPHYTFSVTEDGIYRISYDILENTLPIESVDHADLKIYGKETQIPLYIELGVDNIFNSGDYIEFYAEGNDGWLDSLLYDTPDDIGNPEYSLYNDTLLYFLTYNSEPSLRYTVETDQNFGAHSQANYFLQTISQSFNNAYHVGYSSFGSYSSYFEAGEGWGTGAANGGGSSSGYTFSFTVNTSNVYTGADAPAPFFQGKSNATSNAAFTGIGNHHSSWTIGSSDYTLYEEIFIGYRSTNTTTTFPITELNNGNTSLKFNIINDQGAATDFQAVNFWTLTFPKIPNLNNAQKNSFDVVNGNSGKIRLDLVNAGLVNPTIFVTGSTPRKIEPLVVGSTMQLLIPNSQAEQQQTVKVYAESQIANISNLSPVNGNGFFINYNNLSMEEAYIVVYNKNLETASAAYASYRGGISGGNYNVILAEIGELAMQFGGGIPKHALSVRRFAHYAHTNTTQKPVGLLLIGKGVREATEPNSSSGLGSRKSISAYALSQVPSFGYPSSDVAFTARLNGSTSWAPLIPTGRIAAKTNEELQIYLNKVVEYEAAQDQTDDYTKLAKEWQKQVLHFGGGSNSSEQNLFKAYLGNMEQTIEGPDYGGNVTSFFKENSDPINPVTLTEVNSYLENGVSLMNFFGHATIDGFDQNVDDPVNWNNKGKYPLVIGNACYTGDIFQAGNISTSEEFILTEDAGSIGFLSSVKLGFASYLNIYTSEIYRQFSPASYSATIGEQIIKTIKNIEGNGSNFILRTTCNQMTYHGDPVLKLNWHANPEIDLQIEDVYFTPEDVSLSTDSIDVNIILTNLGKAITDTFGLDVRRDFPASTVDSLYTIPIFGLPYKDTIVLRLPLQPNIGVGINNFIIDVDIPSFIDENYDEVNNNQLTKSFFVNVNGILPVVPYDYAVVPNDTLTIKASTINPIADFNTYRFEIDTTDLFNSPEHRYALVSGYGGVKEVPYDGWTNVNSNNPDNLVLEDSVAYFWRVAVDSSAPQYTESSFQYIKDKTGWGQDHFFQFKNGSFNGITYNRQYRQRQFAPQSTRIISANVFDHANDFYAYNFTRWNIDGNYVEYGMCTTAPSLHLVVVDPVTLEPWQTHDISGNNTQGHNLGQVNFYDESAGSGTCRGRPEYYFIYRQDAAGLAALDNAINNLVPDGFYFMVYAVNFADYSSWDTNYPQLFSTFQNVCYSDSVYSGQDEMAFIYIGQMGNPGFVYETTAVTLGEEIYQEAPIIGANFYGTERSTLIGPSSNWNTLYWKQDTENPVPGLDSTFLKIIPYTASGNQGQVIDTLFTANDSIENFNNMVDAADYPYLRLEAEYALSSSPSPAQLDRWHILYDPLPEAAIDGTDEYLWSQVNDTLKEGEEVSFAVDVRNIYDLDMDSLKVDYWIEDKNRVKHPLPYPRQDSLRVPDVLRDTITFSTTGFPGNNSFWMEINPYKNGSTTETDQPEQLHVNNLLQRAFYVDEDDVNPILDVTFDGNHILNGDIVSAKPEILITLKDDNPFLVMNADSDTSRFGVYITDPSGIQKQIPFMSNAGEPVMQWIPANDNNLKFKIVYSAEFTESGLYTLLVQGSDRSGNLSGDLEYRITFEVVLESSITYMMNYPNPFSTKTQFVFTLTGSEVPDEIKIQILTVTGRVVREITEDELGPIQIGRNITEYAWDGTDEFGDRLANGVYLYTVQAQINGKDIEHRESNADTHFKKNFGKMYLMR